MDALRRKHKDTWDRGKSEAPSLVLFNLRSGFLARLIRWISAHTQRGKRRGRKGPCRPGTTELQMRTSPILRYTEEGSVRFTFTVWFQPQSFWFKPNRVFLRIGFWRQGRWRERRNTKDKKFSLCHRYVLSYDCPNAILAVHKWFVESRDWTSTLETWKARRPSAVQKR